MPASTTLAHDDVSTRHRCAVVLATPTPDDAISATGGAAPLVTPEDYNNGAITFNFAGTAGETQQFTVTTLDDAVLEATETFTVNLDATNALVTDSDTSTGTITDNDNAAVTVEDVSVVEGGGLLFTVTLDNAVQGAFDVNVSLADITATGGAAPLVTPVDYNNGAITLNFAGTAGETQQFTVATLNDAVLEASETFTVSLDTSSALVTDSDTASGTITAPFDFGDAPTSSQSGFVKSYPTTFVDNGARHATSSSLLLGVFVDTEPDGQPTAGANGDDNDNEADDDGVFVVASMVSSSVPTTSSFAVTASVGGKLDAWIDFNQDGDWDDASEQIFNNRMLVAGMNLLSFSVPAGATPGSTGARFRLSSAGGLAPTGAAPDGEVEDYLVMILNGDDTVSPAVEIDARASGTLDVVADGNEIVVRSGAVELFRAPGSSLGRLNISGSAGDDTINVANLDAIFSGLVGVNAGDGNDTLRLTGSGQDLDLTNIADAIIQGLESIDITGSGDNRLALNGEEVLNISPTTDTLRVQHDDGDTVDYKNGWTVEIPQIVGGQYVHVLTQESATVQVVNTTPFQNPLRPLDTNRDGSISPLDALIIVNRLNTSGSVALFTPTSVAGLTEFFYVDTNGDRFVAPVDVIRVVNFLNDPTSNPEGEFAVPYVDLTFVDPVDKASVSLSAEQDDDTPTLYSLAVRPVAARKVSRHETPRCIKTPTSGAEDEDLVGAVDAFFDEFEFLTV